MAQAGRQPQPLHCPATSTRLLWTLNADPSHAMLLPPPAPLHQDVLDMLTGTTLTNPSIPLWWVGVRLWMPGVGIGPPLPPAWAAERAMYCQLGKGGQGRGLQWASSC
jgi:hypothetical protein